MECPLLDRDYSPTTPVYSPISPATAAEASGSFGDFVLSNSNDDDDDDVMMVGEYPKSSPATAAEASGSFGDFVLSNSNDDDDDDVMIVGEYPEPSPAELELRHLRKKIQKLQIEKFKSDCAEGYWECLNEEYIKYIEKVRAWIGAMPLCVACILEVNALKELTDQTLSNIASI
jgi:hypothetical protein